MDQQTVAYLRYVHGMFNLLVFCTLIIFARWGFRTRKARLGGNHDPGPVRKHRRWGPRLLGMTWLGYCAGTGMILLDKGRIFEYPYHAANGLGLVSLLTVNFLISRHLTRTEEGLRNIHYRIGRVVLVLFFTQVLLGVGILL